MPFYRLRFSIFQFFASHRTVLIASLGAAASAFLGFWLQSSSSNAGSNWLWFCLFLSMQVLMIAVGSTPTQYARTTLLDSVLPSIHKILKLGQADRIAIHRLRSKRLGQYEQLTDYFPQGAGQGRVFGFAHGIAGQCFTTPIPHSHAIPEGTSFEKDMQEEWSFTSDELVRLTKDRRSFFTFPIGQDGVHARAVLYMDSPDSSTFADARREDVAKTIQDLFLPLLEQILPR